MKLRETFIEGLKVIQPDLKEDNRGAFFKTYHQEIQKQFGLITDWREEYFSVSNKNVIRGMHFQTPPVDHSKMVTCLKGAVLDVVLDMRLNSKAYGRIFSIELNDQNREVLFIPKGCAHGFLSLKDDTMMFYKVSTVYSPENDKGIYWNSIDFNWNIKDPILSKRDKEHPNFKDFNSPFRL